MKKKGVSPVIATVLLIAMVIVIALIIFLWFKGMSQEKVLKFDQNVELICPDVSFSVQKTTGGVILKNTGDVAIYDFDVKEIGRSYDTKKINTYSSDWPSYGLNPGEIVEVSGSFGENALFIPILAGTADDGGRFYVCDERWGVEL
jgi:flagellin-like protein